MSRHSTIQFRFFFVAIFSVLVLLGFTYTFFWVSSAKTKQISLLRHIAEITRRHMEAVHQRWPRKRNGKLMVPPVKWAALMRLPSAWGRL